MGCPGKWKPAKPADLAVCPSDRSILSHPHGAPLAWKERGLPKSVLCREGGGRPLRDARSPQKEPPGKSPTAHPPDQKGGVYHGKKSVCVFYSVYTQQIGYSFWCGFRGSVSVMP